MKTIAKDKNIRRIKSSVILSDRTPIVTYTKYDDDHLFILVENIEYGPFKTTDIFSDIVPTKKSTLQNYVYAGEDFNGKSHFYKNGKEIARLPNHLKFTKLTDNPISNLEYYEEEIEPADETSVLENLEDYFAEKLSPNKENFTDPYIKERDGLFYFNINKKNYGPYSYIWTYDVLDDEQFQLVYIDPSDENTLHYMLNGNKICSYPLRRPLKLKQISFLTYFPSYCKVKYTHSNEAVFHCLYDNCIYVDGKKVECFNGLCDQILHYDKNGHTLLSGKCKVISYQELNRWYSYDRKLHKNWVSAELMEDGTPLYKEITRNKVTGFNELRLFYGNKQISMQVEVLGLEELTIFAGSLIFYIREGSSYIMMKGKEYQGFRVDENFVIFKDDDEIKLYEYRDDFSTEDELAEYLSKTGLLAGLDEIKKEGSDNQKFE